MYAPPTLPRAADKATHSLSLMCQHSQAHSETAYLTRRSYRDQGLFYKSDACCETVACDRPDATRLECADTSVQAEQRFVSNQAQTRLPIGEPWNNLEYIWKTLTLNTTDTSQVGVINTTTTRETIPSQRNAQLQAP